MKNQTEFKWKLKPQECEGDYFFNGKSIATRTVAEELSEHEIVTIVQMIWQKVKDNNGTDYLFVFEHPDGRKLFVIDQLSKTMMESGDYSPDQILEFNYFTIMYNWEY